MTKPSFLFRRIPNTGHAITGYEGSLLSFYLSVSDVSIDILYSLD
jgi:hypothetical protein